MSRREPRSPRLLVAAPACLLTDDDGTVDADARPLDGLWYDGQRLLSRIVAPDAPPPELHLDTGELRVRWAAREVRVELGVDGRSEGDPASVEEVDEVAMVRGAVLAWRVGPVRVTAWAPGAEVLDSRDDGAVLELDEEAELRLTWACRDASVPQRAPAPAWTSRAASIAGSTGLDEDVLARALADLELLRLATPEGVVTAAGVPRRASAVGRDSLLTALMVLEHVPELAEAALRHHAADDDAVDSTPLWLLLLGRAHRSGAIGDADVRALWPHALAARDWIDETEARGEGIIRSNEQLPGAARSWTSAAGARLDRHGRAVAGPVAPIEAQGYAVAARRELARLSMVVAGDELGALRLAHQADALAARIVERYMVVAGGLDAGDPRDGGWLAQAVDERGDPVDALCSSPGHLLWCGALDGVGEGPNRPGGNLGRHVARQLAHPVLRSGWGVRTMSTLDAGHDPQGWRAGAAWPHDTAICIAGMARAGEQDLARELASELLEAATAFDGRLPEVLVGTARRPGEPPHPHAATCPLAATSAAAPLLLASVLADGR